MAFIKTVVVIAALLKIITASSKFLSEEIIGSWENTYPVAIFHGVNMYCDYWPRRLTSLIESTAKDEGKEVYAECLEIGGEQGKFVSIFTEFNVQGERYC